MRRAQDEYLDSREPEPPLRALKRIAHEAHEIRQRLSSGIVTAWCARSQVLPGTGTEQKSSGSNIAVSADLVKLAVLVAELADQVRSIEKER